MSSTAKSCTLRWRLVLGLIVLVFGGPIAVLHAQPRCAGCAYDPAWNDSQLVERSWACRGCDEVIATNRALRARQDAAIAPLLAFARQKPEARSWALAHFENLGSATDAAYAALGPELVEWRLEGHTGSNTQTDARRLQKVGTAATPILRPRLREVCAMRDWQVLEAAGIIEDKALAPDLASVAGRSGCDVRVRVVAASVLARLDRAKGVAILEGMLDDPPFAGEREDIAKSLARRGGPAGIALATKVLQDPSVDRSARWNIAEVLRSTGDPQAVAIADRYQPSGRRGNGNPESYQGLGITGGLLAGTLLLVGVWPREDQLTRRARFAVVALSVVAAHVLGGIALYVVSFVLTPFAPPLYLVAGIMLVILGPLVPALRAIRREWQLTGLSPAVLAVAAAVGLLLSIYIDRTVYWYLARVETMSLLNALSPLQQAVAWSVPLVASYWPAASFLPSARRENA